MWISGIIYYVREFVSSKPQSVRCYQCNSKKAGSNYGPMHFYESCYSTGKVHVIERYTSVPTGTRIYHFIIVNSVRAEMVADLRGGMEYSSNHCASPRASNSDRCIPHTCRLHGATLGEQQPSGQWNVRMSRSSGVVQHARVNGATTCDTLYFKSSSRGFHVFKQQWHPLLGEELSVKREPNNLYGSHSVAVAYV
jgi:hypothetical protein